MGHLRAPESAAGFWWHRRGRSTDQGNTRRLKKAKGRRGNAFHGRDKLRKKENCEREIAFFLSQRPCSIYSLFTVYYTLVGVPTIGKVQREVAECADKKYTSATAQWWHASNSGVERRKVRQYMEVRAMLFVLSEYLASAWAGACVFFLIPQQKPRFRLSRLGVNLFANAPPPPCDGGRSVNKRVRPTRQHTHRHTSMRVA